MKHPKCIPLHQGASGRGQRSSCIRTIGQTHGCDSISSSPARRGWSRRAVSGKSCIASGFREREDVYGNCNRNNMALFKTFKGGDVVPESGVYKALHSTPHRLPWRVIYLEGDHFQRCKLCPLGVLYRLEVPCVPHTQVVTAPREEFTVSFVGC